jgi:hypothetical protein
VLSNVTNTGGTVAQKPDPTSFPAEAGCASFSGALFLVLFGQAKRTIKILAAMNSMIVQIEMVIKK